MSPAPTQNAKTYFSNGLGPADTGRSILGRGPRCGFAFPKGSARQTVERFPRFTSIVEWKIFMKRILTGSIAGATGMALLLGGAGTFALWNSSAAIAGAPLTAGTLTVETADVVFWTDQYGTEINLESYKIVPGDVLTYTSFLNVTARGDNLHARIAIDHGSISSENSDASTALKILLDKTTIVSVDIGDAIYVPHAYSDDQTWFDLSEGDHELRVTVVIEFLESFDDVDDDDAKNASALLSNLGVILTQTP